LFLQWQVYESFSNFLTWPVYERYFQFFTMLSLWKPLSFYLDWKFMKATCTSIFFISSCLWGIHSFSLQWQVYESYFHFFRIEIAWELLLFFTMESLWELLLLFEIWKFMRATNYNFMKATFISFLYHDKFMRATFIFFKMISLWEFLSFHNNGKFMRATFIFFKTISLWELLSFLYNGKSIRIFLIRKPFVIFHYNCSQS
jgi:hypothetical protein